MPTSELSRTHSIHSRHSVESYFNLAGAIDELREELRPGKDPSRWNPFVAATIPDTATVAVVAPKRWAGAVRLTGEIFHVPDGTSLAIEAVRGRRGRSVRITHEITLTRARSFLTTARLSTTIRGPAAVLVSRRRVADWHLNEIYNLRTRIERNHTLRHTPVLRGEQDRPRRPLDPVHEQALA